MTYLFDPTVNYKDSFYPTNHRKEGDDPDTFLEKAYSDIKSSEEAMDYIRTFKPTFYNDLARSNYAAASDSGKQHETNSEQPHEVFVKAVNREAREEHEQDKDPESMEVSDNTGKKEEEKEKPEELLKTNETSELSVTSITPRYSQEEQQPSVEKEEIKQELEKTVQKRKIEVTPQKEGKKPNKGKSPGQKQSIRKMEDDQVIRSKRSSKQTLRKQGQSDDVISRAKRRLEQELRRQRFKRYLDSDIEATSQKDKSTRADEKHGLG